MDMPQAFPLGPRASIFCDGLGIVKSAQTAEKDLGVCRDPKMNAELLKAHLWSDFESLEGKVFISLYHTRCCC